MTSSHSDRPEDPTDANLTRWIKDPANPITVTHPDGSPAYCYAGPGNLWTSADGNTTEMVMIYNTATGLFTSDDPTLHKWTLKNPEFYPRRGGGGGLFFPLPGNTASPRPPGPYEPSYTHMLQSDFSGDSDGTAYYALGKYNPSTGTFDNATTTRCAGF